MVSATMELMETPTFDHRDRKDIYEYVEQNGAMEPEKLRRALGMEPRAFGHHVAILERDNILEEHDGTLRLAIDVGTEEAFEQEGIEVTIRQAREEDLTGLVGAIRAAIGTGNDVRAESVADVVDSEGVLLRHNEIECRIFFVATVGGDIVGWVHVKHRELEKLSHTGELTVGVLDPYQGNGIGTRLLERGLAWADGHGLEKIYNSVPATNERAIDFFESRGFEVEVVRPDHYKIDGKYVDEVMLATQLED